ncbi:hypothetical protein [Listeria rocourtiae]|uniref:Uncharacterized protein n=1 Tax=Listeria rocourtiae TaxID=647910 RepID=A0A4R6ZIL5_9LIST|nr:hypothetical protein [Listeria rocourtiae]EUJ42633.1 hypothetical protein PROCOU_16824 [Listeria rocourtiae FSL F6-920]TDR51789.1 hypothetical protein DFP96_11197 [Listeria rocourtiae]
MEKKIQLPSGKLSEHATSIWKNTDALTLKLRPNVTYSTGNLQDELEAEWQGNA